MSLLSRLCAHEGCTKLVFSSDKCHRHDGSAEAQLPKKKSTQDARANSKSSGRKRPPIDMTERTISVSKDGTQVRAYKQCTAEGCTNIAKKGRRCYKHGAPRRKCSVEGCGSYAQVKGVCAKHCRCSVRGCRGYPREYGGVCQEHHERPPHDDGEAQEEEHEEELGGSLERYCWVVGCSNQLSCSKGRLCQEHSPVGPAGSRGRTNADTYRATVPMAEEVFPVDHPPRYHSNSPMPRREAVGQATMPITAREVIPADHPPRYCNNIYVPRREAVGQRHHGCPWHKNQWEAGAEPHVGPGGRVGIVHQPSLARRPDNISYYPAMPTAKETIPAHPAPRYHNITAPAEGLATLVEAAEYAARGPSPPSLASVASPLVHEPNPSRSSSSDESDSEDDEMGEMIYRTSRTAKRKRAMEAMMVRSSNSDVVIDQSEGASSTEAGEPEEGGEASTAEKGPVTADVVPSGPVESVNVRLIVPKSQREVSPDFVDSGAEEKKLKGLLALKEGEYEGTAAYHAEK